MTVKERPILFSAPMVCALRAGRKTQTRRVVKGLPAESFEEVGRDVLTGEFHFVKGALGYTRACPYGDPRDRLWVRETHAVVDREVIYRADIPDLKEEESVVRGARRRGTKVDPWTPSIHMPRWASRINLEITEVRVERLQEISEADALAEGARQYEDKDPDYGYAGWYRSLWEEINGPESWAANPWVWVVSFKLLERTT